MLTSLTLQNFRTYKQYTITIHPRLTVITGPNAIGKTNILEAMYALAIGKSFRAQKEGEMISWGKQGTRVIGTTDEEKLELLIATGKTFLVNGVARRQIDFTGRLPSVLFWPQDLSLVIGSPGVRREYLNRILVQTDREYRRMLLAYEKGLRQRNKVLLFIHEGASTRSELLYWDKLLIQAGQYISAKREELVNFLNSLTFSSLSYQLEYDKSVISEERLKQYKDEEVAAKATLVGPHRDDVLFRIKKIENKQQGNNQEYIDLEKYGSRGEQRLGVLWYKLGELAYLEKEKKKKPMLLLDDICSELDCAHQQYIVSLLPAYQTVMTTADRSILDRLGNTDMNVIEL
jgi:DNA replication and repair protein RecF